MPDAPVPRLPEKVEMEVTAIHEALCSTIGAEQEGVCPSDNPCSGCRVLIRLRRAIAAAIKRERADEQRFFFGLSKKRRQTRITTLQDQADALEAGR